MALRRRDGGRRQAASPAQRRCAGQHPAVFRRRARRRPSKLCISGARQPVRDPAPPTRPPAQFRRATTVGGSVRFRSNGRSNWSAGPPRPTRRFSGAGNCEAASHAPIHQDPRLPPPARCPCGCTHGPCRSLAAPARCPMRRTAQAQPVDAAPGPTATRADRAGAQGPGRPPPATSRPRSFRPAPVGGIISPRARIRRLFLVSQPIPELLTIVHAVD